MKTTLLNSVCVLLASSALLEAQTAQGPVTAPTTPQSSYVEKPLPNGRFEVAPFFGYRFGGGIEDVFTGKSYDFDDSEAYGLTIDLGPTASEMKVEFQWSRQDTSLNFHGAGGLGKIDLSVDEFQLGGVAEMGKNRFREFVSVSVGATYFATDYGDDTRFSFEIGGGVKYYLARHFVVRADLRGFCTVVDSESAFIFHNGVTVAHFSGSTLWQGQATVGVGVVF